MAAETAKKVTGLPELAGRPGDYPRAPIFRSLCANRSIVYLKVTMKPSLVNSDSRKQVLESLIGFNDDLGKTRRRLANFSWDSVEKVTLTADHIRAVLERLINGQLSEREVEDWADLIECREDIAYEEKMAAAIKQVVFELANPVLSGALNPEKARGLLSKLDKSDLDSGEGSKPSLLSGDPPHR